MKLFLHTDTELFPVMLPVKMILVFVLLFCGVTLGEKRRYDTYTSEPVTADVLRKHEEQNNTFWCTLEVEDCDPNEGRRLDGACNNLKKVTRGAAHTPYHRLLPAVYGKDFEPRKAKSGEDLPLARRVRTSLLSEGKVPDDKFTQLLTYYWVFMAADYTAPNDTVNYSEKIRYCCTPRGKTESICVSNEVPNDDPVHRFDDIRCLDMTRPGSFQSFGCLAPNTTPERLSTVTPVFDLDILYGNILQTALNARLYEGGLLKYEEENGRIWPPKGPVDVCLLNQLPEETRCHGTANTVPNSLFGINLNTIWFLRQHNKIATELAKINSCWDDEKLFYTARDINIAIATQIYLYELLPLVMGEDNLIKDNIITPTLGFRDFYNPESPPQQSLEYLYALRWVHTVQESTLKMMDTEGHHIKDMSINNLTFRTGYLGLDNNIDLFTQGAFRQPSGKFDYIVDPDMTGIGMGALLRSNDILTNDLAKARYFGFPPYIKYREFCSNVPHKSWKDLKYLIDEERLVKLKDVYQHVEDIDLLAGIWTEKYIEGGFVPPTFYCIVIDQLRRTMISDRHFYERPNRPNAFTAEQLNEIRKASISGFMCNIGDTVTQIQPHGFLQAGPGNELAACENIPKVNLGAWKDKKCA